MCIEMQQNIYVNSIIFYLILIKMDWSDNIQWKSAIVNVENNIQLTAAVLIPGHRKSYIQKGVIPTEGTVQPHSINFEGTAQSQQ